MLYTSTTSKQLGSLDKPAVGTEVPYILLATYTIHMQYK